MATRGRPKKDSTTFYLETIERLEQVEANLKKQLDEKSRQLDDKDNELGSLEDDLDHLKEIIKSLAEVL
jgi:chromosome segregation ATPase